MVQTLSELAESRKCSSPIIFIKGWLTLVWKYLQRNNRLSIHVKYDFLWRYVFSLWLLASEWSMCMRVECSDPLQHAKVNTRLDNNSSHIYDASLHFLFLSITNKCIVCTMYSLSPLLILHPYASTECMCAYIRGVAPEQNFSLSSFLSPLFCSCSTFSFFIISGTFITFGVA